MAVHLITGFKGEEHIQSADQGSFNASFFGGGEFVMEAGNQCEASIINNNTVRVLDGDILMKGRHIRIPYNTYIDMNIQTGTAGVNRNDMIVMEYSKDSATGIETADLKVIRGAAVEGTATDPAFVQGDILGGANLNQMPLYRVKIEGVVLASVEQLFTAIPTYRTLAEQYATEFQQACESHLDSLNILDSMEEIEANTQENQLAGALGVKELITSLFTEEEIRQIVGSYYDKETDIKYLLNANNEWVAVGYGGLLIPHLYNEGLENDLYPLDFSTNYYYNGTYNTNYIPTRLEKGIRFDTTNQVCSCVGTKNMIDLSNTTSIKIVYTENGIEKEMSLDVTGINEGYIVIARNSNIFGIFVSSSKANFGHGQSSCIKDIYVTSDQDAVKILKKWWLE